ncbi:MAG: flagellar protein FlgN [Candidatus Omnitrophica bacterium]|nr:flagellar protein FlgN [Candidatus Omnitrophota bacterium]
MTDTHRPLRDELVRIVSEECVLYAQLLALMKAKTDILVNNDVGALNKNTSDVNEFIAHLEDLESARKDVILAISQKENIPLKEVTVTRLTTHWNDPSLIELQQKLQAVMQDLKDINQRNQRLVKQAHDMFSFMRDLFYSAFAQGPATSYTSEGKIDQREGGSFEKEI